MSYTTIQFNGKQEGLKYNNFGIAQMNEELEMSKKTETIIKDGAPVEVATQNPFAFMYALIWGGLEGNRKAQRKEASYTFEQVIDFIDGMAITERTAMIEKASTALMETQLWKDSSIKEEPVYEGAVDKKKESEMSTEAT